MLLMASILSRQESTRETAKGKPECRVIEKDVVGLSSELPKSSRLIRSKEISTRIPYRFLAFLPNTFISCKELKGGNTQRCGGDNSCEMFAKTH